jgi:hypothetical protein
VTVGEERRRERMDSSGARTVLEVHAQGARVDHARREGAGGFRIGSVAHLDVRREGPANDAHDLTDRGEQ